uniref:glutathione transferase n=1 Tax=Culicoides sonorensis TaxID=179676 RepID=A0A336K1W7_CULSO
MTKLKLYHCAPSPPSRAALFTIRYLGLDAEVQNINLFGKEQLEPWYVAINPQHTVPTLDDNGFYLWESRAICAYLANKYAPGSDLYPTDAKTRAIVDQRLYFDATTLFPRTRAIAFNALFLGESVITEEKKKPVFEAFGWLNGFLEKSKYVAGDKPTIADISLIATMSGMIHLGAPLTDFPNIQRWWNDCKSFPGFDENDEGAKFFAGKIKEKLTQGF